MTREQLAGAVRVALQTSSRAAHPSASASLPAGFILVGGGFRVNWQPGQGNLATASFPEFGNVWTARSKDHFVSSPCTIDSFAIGLAAQLPVGRVERAVSSDESGVAAHPSITEPMNGPFVLTGIGAEARSNEPGSLLWRLEPAIGGSEPGVTASAKDHEVSSPGTVKAWAIGARLI